MGLFSWLSNSKKVEEAPPVEKRRADFSSFKNVTDFIYEKSGIVDLDKRALTASRLQQYAIKENIYTTAEFMRRMEQDNDFYQEIINIATVNETFFFRELKELDWLIEHISSSSKRLNILSMPSSSGEEIYSILLLMAKKGLTLDKVSIKGYDINSDAVSRAQKAKYDEHSLHKIDASLRAKYFTKNSDGSYEVSQEIKKHANFTQQNIFDLADSREKFDVILSRNMFIYFDDQKRKMATDIIVNMLNTEAVFIKGHADQISKNSNLKSVQHGVFIKQ